MSKSNEPTGDQYPTVGAVYQAIQPLVQDWWYSADGRRGFCWDEVCAYDFRKSGTGSFVLSALYLYVKSGIFHLEGVEAEVVHTELVKRRGAQ